MKKRLLSLALVLSMLLSCAACTGKTDDKTAEGKVKPTADGSPRHEYTVIDSEDPYWFNYLKEWGTDGPCIIIDGLIGYDMYGVVVPNMATEWKKSDDGLKYTYTLRQGAKWVNHKGEEYAEVTAEDFVAGLQYILTAKNECGTANLVYDYVVNAKDYYDEKLTDFSKVGIKALDKYTVEYTLIAPTPFFLKLSGYNCYWPVSQKFLDERGDKFGTTNEDTLYNGSYYCPVKQPEDRTEFVMNNNYWDVEHTYISKITTKFNKDTTIQGEMFQRGEVDRASIPAELKKEWVEDAKGKGLWAQKSPYDANAWFYGFNFEPKYEGDGVEDYKIAVNNVNFRKSVFHSIDRLAICFTGELWKPEQKIMRTITPEKIFDVGGVDYTQIGPMKAISDTDPYDVKKGVEYKKKAMSELNGKVKFPITLVLPYNTADKGETNYSQLIKQQLETALGKEYLNVKLEAYAPTNYNTMSRSSGKFSIKMLRWGADYADPASYTDVFNEDLGVGHKFNRPFLATEYLDKDGVSKYTKMMREACAERLDIKKRYDMLAEAEAFLINEAIVMPIFHGAGGWKLNKLHPYIGCTGQFGRDEDIMKGKKIMEKPLSHDEMLELEKQYYADREKALKEAKNQN